MPSTGDTSLVVDDLLQQLERLQRAFLLERLAAEELPHDVRRHVAGEVLELEPMDAEAEPQGWNGLSTEPASPAVYPIAQLRNVRWNGRMPCSEWVGYRT
jgi:hypothetical protein